MNRRLAPFFIAGSAFPAFFPVASSRAVPVTIDLADCEKPSGNETVCSPAPLGIPDHVIPGGEPLSIDFSLSSAAPAHLVAFESVTWLFDLSFCCDEVQPYFTLTLSDLNGTIPGFGDIAPDDASACELFGDCAFTVPIPGSTSIYGLEFTSLYEQRESVIDELTIRTEGADHFAFAVPEPAAGSLLLLGLAGLLGYFGLKAKKDA